MESQVVKTMRSFFRNVT